MEDKLASDTHVLKTGWLEKKGKRRWFALLKEDKELLWFATPHPRYRIRADHAKGLFNLEGSSIERIDNSLSIRGTKTLTLIATSNHEADEWFVALRTAQAEP